MRNSLEAFHKSVKPSQWWFFNRYMVPFITYPVHFIVIFPMYHWVFHCGFSLDTQHISLWFFKWIPGYFSLYTQHISLRFFITYPVHFIAVFHYIPSTFHCSFSLYTQCISLWFFKCIPGYFIAIFQQLPTAFHCRIFKCSPGYLIVIFQMLLWIFHCTFQMDAWHFQWLFHSQLQNISLFKK